MCLLDECTMHPAWIEIEKKLNVIDMLVLCSLNVKMHHFIKQRFQNMGDFFFCGLMTCGKTYRTVSFPLGSMSLYDFNKNKRTATIVCTTKQECTNDDFCLIIPLNNPIQCATTLYATDTRLHLANGIYNATLCRMEDLSDDTMLIDRLCLKNKYPCL